jgi:hypothetical protein
MRGLMRTCMSYPLINKSFIFSMQKRAMTYINPEDELMSYPTDILCDATPCSLVDM